MKKKLIDKFADISQNMSEVAKSVVEDGSTEKYIQAVETLHDGDTHREMRKLIVNSEEFSDAEKLRRLAELDDREMASKKEHGESIKSNREHAANTALKIVAGVLTAGMSVAVPEIAKTVSEKKAARLAKTAESLPLIEDAITLEPKEITDADDE